MVFLAFVAVFAVACGGDDDDGGSSASNGVVIAAADADRVAHAGLPALADLPGAGWEIASQDDFGSGGSGDSDFLTMIQGTPECATLENLTTLESVFGGSDTPDEEPIGQAQIEFDQQDPEALIPTSVDVEIKVDQSAGGSKAQFAIVKSLFESEETSNCLITVLNSQFAETGPSGLTIEVKKGTGAATTPEDGARMAFDIDMSVAGLNLQMAMQLYFWPYGNANVQAMFLGTAESLNADLVGGVLKTVDNNLQEAAGK